MILVFVETAADGATEVSLETVTFARSLAERSGQPVHALVIDHRDQHRMISRMRVAVIRRVMQKRVPAPQLGMKFLHRPRHQIRPCQHMNGLTLRHRQQLIICRQHTTREVASVIDHP